MDISKAEHFFWVLFSSGALLQDVAYGTTKIKFKSGEEQRIGHAIITSKSSNTITFYKKYHDSIHYQPLSKSRLWCILNSIGPSQRKCSPGLDDNISAAMNGFETLKNTAELFKRKDLTASLERGKRYLKTHFQLNCCDSPVRSILHLLFQIHETYHFKRQILLILMAHVMVAIIFFL